MLQTKHNKWDKSQIKSKLSLKMDIVKKDPLLSLTEERHCFAFKIQNILQQIDMDLSLDLRFRGVSVGKEHNLFDTFTELLQLVSCVSE